MELEEEVTEAVAKNEPTKTNCYTDENQLGGNKISKGFFGPIVFLYWSHVRTYVRTYVWAKLIITKVMDIAALSEESLNQ